MNNNQKNCECFACGAIVPHVNAQTWFCDHCEEESIRALTADERCGIARDIYRDDPVMMMLDE